MCSDWKQELVTFSQFLERMRTNKSSSMEPTYLAQHPLFDQVYICTRMFSFIQFVYTPVCHTEHMVIRLTQMGR